MSTKNVKYFVEDNKKILETVSEMRLGITTLTADLVCRDTIAMKFVLGSRKADGLKWASNARLFMVSNPCAFRRLLVANLKRLHHMLHHIE